MAAVLAYGERAALSHMTGLGLWDLRESASARIDVTVATHNGLSTRAGIRVHRCGSLRDDEVTIHDGIRVTTVARSLLDGAATLGPPSLHRAVERSEILELFDLKAVLRTIDRHPTHPGAKRLIAAIDIFREAEITRSDLEAMFLGLCEMHGFPRPLVNQILHGEEVDFLWADHRLAVEVDGRETHLTRQAFERDRAKDAKLTVAGHRVVRFTYRQVLHDPATVAQTLRALLEVAQSRAA